MVNTAFYTEAGMLLEHISIDNVAINDTVFCSNRPGNREMK